MEFKNVLPALAIVVLFGVLVFWVLMTVPAAGSGVTTKPVATTASAVLTTVSHTTLQTQSTSQSSAPSVITSAVHTSTSTQGVSTVKSSSQTQSQQTTVEVTSAESTSESVSSPGTAGAGGSLQNPPVTSTSQTSTYHAPGSPTTESNPLPSPSVVATSTDSTMDTPPPSCEGNQCNSSVPSVPEFPLGAMSIILLAVPLLFLLRGMAMRRNRPR